MGITYTKQGDYLLPNLTLKNKSKQNIGKYGLLRLNYLKRHNKALYYQLLSRDKLTEHLIDIDKLATEKVDKIINELSEKNNIDEKLKQSNQLKWVGIMNNFRLQAEEIALVELIYN